MDPFRVLGLDPGASQAEVKRAYRRLAKALHPDAAGEGALPAFLELQDAYERLTGTKVRTVRAPGPTGGSGSRSGASRGPGAASESTAAGAEGFREPWRADPARARAAREQARARRPWPGTAPGWASDPASGPVGAGGTTGGKAGGARRSAPGPGTASGPAAGRESDTGTASHSTDGQARAGGRRRATRKATLGSTSYDEAREPTDRHWAGASWYGPTTGE
ncbi:MAG TPA: J domain-containing protein, partial [Candidatus Limnocylindrales bacterium]|nr:J domain-containing protein [Candidatus Limnocylindrales bacterium]